MNDACRSTPGFKPMATFNQATPFPPTGPLCVFRYLLTLFCGLLPLPLPDLWTGDIHVERDSVAIEEINIRDPWPSKAPSPLTKMEPFVAPGKEKESSTGPKLPQLVSQVAESSQKSQRRVRFEPVSELAFRGCVEAGAA